MGTLKSDYKCFLQNYYSKRSDDFLKLSQILYYGVRCRSRHSVSKGPLVETHSVIKAKCKHLPTITSYVSPLPTKSKTLWGPRNKEYSRTPSQHNKNEEHSKEHSSFLVRWKGLEPPTYWFVASHSIQLSYQRIYVLHVFVLR